MSQPFKPKFDDCFECQNWARKVCGKCTAGEFFEEESDVPALDEINPFEKMNRTDDDDE